MYLTFHHAEKAWGVDMPWGRITDLIEANREWIAGIDLLCYCHQTDFETGVNSCAKLRQELGLSGVMPICVGQSGSLSLSNALTVLDWMFSSGTKNHALCVIADSFIPDHMDKQGGCFSMSALIGVSTMAGDYRVESCRKLPGSRVRVGVKSAVEPILKLGLHQSEFTSDLEMEVITFDAGVFGASQLKLRRT
ncbi:MULTISPECIES: hypothetical protein [Paenibacillus]|uniref:hypothetical protein n=1 Tax=Paenibacillus TaxID=44249 RepID=UPI001F42F845|nr:hypothetical protein [Paenibacillus sp. JJ-223]CAH1191948.1 hypothetical protein PAECIP111890_00598 [Paenibacillus sp. JJ-223]